MKILRPQNIYQFARYLIVGGSTAILYFGLLLFSVEYLNFGHLAAVSLAYMSAISFHFLANKIFTFRSRGANVVREVARYLCVALVNYIVTLVVVFLVVDLARQSTYFGATVAVAVTLGLGYGMTKFWVFQYGRGSL